MHGFQQQNIRVRNASVGAVKRRIMDMGITKGTEIYVRKVAPLGGTLMIKIALAGNPNSGKTTLFNGLAWYLFSFSIYS